MSSAGLDHAGMPTVRHWKRYGDYVQTNVDWLDRLPSHWRLGKLGALSTVKARLGWKGLKADEYVDDGFIFLSTPNIKEAEIDFANVNYITAERYHESPEIMLEEGDVLIAKDGSTLGTTNVVRFLPAAATVNSSVAVVRPAASLDGVFLSYLFKSSWVQSVIQRMKGGMGVPHLFQADLRKFAVIVPPLSEQRAIAAFLDRETTRIDALIAHKERLIALLEEKRQAVISRAVTRGLDPDVRLKDSGVPWLGVVPAHWEVKKLRYWVQFLNYRRIPLSAEERGGLEKIYPYYGASGMIDHVDRYLFDEPLVLIGEDGANLLSRSSPLAYIAAGKYWVNNHAHILRPKHGPLVFWTERLNSISYTPFVSGSAQPKLTIESLSAVDFAAPDPAEQASIASFISETQKKTDPIIARIRDGIVRLREYRAALISAAVTGQIDVRGEVG